jgi:two-component system sensor histidine kinase KdpD
MLEEARTLKQLGTDIIVGYVETHGRTETKARLDGLTVLPRKKIFYKGKELEEFDIDTALARHPEIILVDELAHSNVPGSRNEKRYQDIDELRTAGINVISTLNIQHLESLNNIIEHITGVEVTERIPDSVLRSADEIVNVDLTTDELIARLREGKIYEAGKIELALRNFFQRDNLQKLRELALREVANQLERTIDVETLEVKKKQFGRIAVCISDNKEMSELLIRKTARLADRFDVQWYVIFVETPDLAPEKIKLSTQRYLINNFKLATELGAHVDKLVGSDIAETVAQYARGKQIQLLVIGKPTPKRFQKLFGQSIVDKLMEKLEEDEIDIQVISK